MPVGLVQIVLIFTMLVSGFLRSLIIVPNLLLFQNSNPNTDQVPLSIWLSLIFLGDIVSLKVVDEFIKAGVQENLAFLVFVGIFLISALVMHCTVDER